MDLVDDQKIALIAQVPKELEATASTAGYRPTSEAAEKDHRGVTLPARHRAGGIITPQ